MAPELNVQYVHATSLGYGRMGSKIVEALPALGVDVYDGLPSPDGVWPEFDNEGHARRYKKTNCVTWMSVPTHARGWYRGQHASILTMWEATQLPEAFRENLHEFDLVMVPSKQNQELFSQYHDNVKLVTLGVDPKRWHYRKPDDPGQFFNFLIGGSGPRKGTDLAYKAFRKAFSSWPKDGPIPRLMMKNPKGEDFYGDRIDMIGGRISADDESDLYATAHCYLQPSRGEGFGLQPLQAMAMGRPTILTAAHGHDSFAHLGLGVPAKVVPCDAYFIYGDPGEWWEPDFDELCDRMLWVYNNWEQAAADARASAETIAREFTWENSARLLVDAIGLDKMSTPFAGGEWFEPDSKRFLVRVNKPWTADIAGVKYQFDVGRDYWELADVKRILFEAGLLEPSCLSNMLIGSAEGMFDSGLTENQAKRIPGYTAAHSYCHACGQPLGSRPSRADEIFEELQRAAGVL